MSSLAYGLISLAILYVIWWYIRNERVGTDSPGDKGFIAMTAKRAHESEDKKVLIDEQKNQKGTRWKAEAN